MAKKKKKGKGKKKGEKKKEKKVDPRLEEFLKLSPEEIKARKDELMLKLKDIRRSRNYYMLERDAVQQYHYIACQENEQLKTEILNMEGGMERKAKEHDDTVQVYMQKVTHLEYEHNHNVSLVAEMASKDLAEETYIFESKKKSLSESRQQLEENLEGDKAKFEKTIKVKREQNHEAIVQTKNSLREEHERLQNKYDARLNQLVEDLELRRRIEIHEIEERKNSHLHKLLTNHEQSFNEMRTYYNGLTRDNLGLISSLKEELSDLKVKQVQHEKTIDDYTQRNKQLQKPKAEAEAEVKELEDKLRNYLKDKQSLKNARARALVLEEQLKKSHGEHKALEEKYRRAQEECKELFGTFQEVVLTVQKKGQAKNRELEAHLGEKTKKFNEKKAQFNALLGAANLDPAVLQHMTTKLDDELGTMTAEIKELSYENAKVSKAHDDLVRVYEAKVKSFGIPENEWNSRPLLGSTTTAPADLIVSS